MKRFSTNQLSSLPSNSGVYFFTNSDGVILYIGKAVNLRNRVKSYFQKGLLAPKTEELVKQIEGIEVVKTDNEFEALLLEAQLIRKHQPKYNAMAKDDKHPLYIKISHETFPKITTVRRKDGQRATYFGPFPESTAIVDTLKYLRTIFPYCTEQRIGKKPCFYAHIRLCNPCPNSIVRLAHEDQTRQTKHYRTNILHIKYVLSGKYKLVMRQLNNEMQHMAGAMRFEEAAAKKGQIDKLNYLTEPHQTAKAYLTNPNLYEDLRNEELDSLATLLHIPTPYRIEGFDISNTQGKQATGSMVVFIHAAPDTSQYRRFKIRQTYKPNDVGMMGEMLKRRFVHTEWEYPDLILIDGGEGQVGAAVRVLTEIGTPIPVIGLAKRHEEIVLPEKTNGSIAYHHVRVRRCISALKLLQRVRDEAHRFAKKYHVLLRKKSMVY